ncbi:MAG: hypothetical protein ACREXV_14505 [Polaromonas sp.]
MSHHVAAACSDAIRCLCWIPCPHAARRPVHLMGFSEYRLLYKDGNTTQTPATLPKRRQR